MKLAVITCWTGGQEMADMTNRMVNDLRVFSDWFMISVYGQGTDVELYEPGSFHVSHATYGPINRGFAFGMNQALDSALLACSPYNYGGPPPPEAVLCLNNDLEFPDPLWFRKLIEEPLDKVLVPTTNFTACNEQRAEGPVDADPIDLPSTPAVCWLLPWAACEVLFKHSGGYGKLFREDIGMAWGEDGFASAALQRDFDPNPYRIVPRSFVRHLGERTSSQIPAKEKMACYHRSRELIRSVLGD